jgi:mono/diheme cytochrome c family protein
MGGRTAQSQIRWSVAACCVLNAVLPWIQSTAQGRDSASRSQWVLLTRACSPKNPVSAAHASIIKGEKIYKARCVGCHGSAGDGNGPDAPQLHVHPARLSGPQVQIQSDGLLWRKITFGKRPMPAFGLRLSPTDRWHVINYLRTLADDKPPTR